MVPQVLLTSGSVFIGIFALATVACSSDESQAAPLGGAQGGNGSNGVAGTLNLGIPDAAGASTEPEPELAGGSGPYMLPDGYTPANNGGWLLGEPVEAGAAPLPPGGNGTLDGCGTEILGIVRDFRRGDQPGGHPDFETYKGKGEQGILEPLLDDNLKPILAVGEHKFITSAADFEQWYRNVPDVNQPFFINFSLAPSDGILTFFSDAFFPLDDVGFGNQDLKHNFGFTTEVHTEFRYVGGETFTFTGDDDLWVFINRRLAIDLGGLHSPQTKTIELDVEAPTLELEPGNVYSLELFHAERHSGASNFRIDTNLQFTNCGRIVDEVVK